MKKSLSGRVDLRVKCGRCGGQNKIKNLVVSSDISCARLGTRKITRESVGSCGMSKGYVRFGGDGISELLQCGGIESPLI